MKTFILFLSLFFLALSLPMAYFVLRAYQGIEQQETEELRYFASKLLNEIEEELMALTLREEKRSVDEYSDYLIPETPGEPPQRSPLAERPENTYILGYFQNNPDGSFQAPFAESGGDVPPAWKTPAERLFLANSMLNTMKVDTLSNELDTQPLGAGSEIVAQRAYSLEQKYLDIPRLQEQKSLRSPKDTSTQQKITRDQLYNIARRQSVSLDDWGVRETQERAEAPAPTETFDVEVAPLQSLLISEREMLLFRRIAIGNQIYRQGFVLLVEELIGHLKSAYFEGQPLENFTRLEISLATQDTTEEKNGGHKEFFTLTRTFPRPFSFLQAEIRSVRLPESPERTVLNIMRVLMGLILILGLAAMYQSAHTIFELSERRSTFVSSVTHELKTPLTNIRMYAEMLEQGIAPTREREEEYLRVIGSESQRLSRLIENVLDFSKLEKKQRRFNLQKGDFDDVLQEVRTIMQETLRKEGFTFTIERGDLPEFYYDREVMVQVLLNLLDNSVKFGNASPRREITLRLAAEKTRVLISVSDTGPGIPRSALKKIFDDFYRGEHEISRATRGTGIGLALVKKFITALHGTIHAENNSGPGCRITISLPRQC